MTGIAPLRLTVAGILAGLALTAGMLRGAEAPGVIASALEVIPVTTGVPQVVYRSTGRMESPHFSPDGKELYFNRDGKILRLRLGAKAPVLVDTGLAQRCNNDHGLSPDGTQLVISDLTESGQSLMYLLPIGGGTPRRIAAAAPAYWHGWSPDGQTLAYCAARGGEYDVYTIPAAGGTEMRLTTAPGNDNGPDYSADGKWIYFHSMRTAGHVQVWRMHPDGSNQEQVTADDWFNWFPHPSPDGKWIALLSSHVTPVTGHPPEGEYAVRLIRGDGTGEPRILAHITAGNGSFNVPCWSRDGARLACATFELQTSVSK